MLGARSVRLVGAALLVAYVGSARADDVAPVGDEFQVSSVATGSKLVPDVAIASSGEGLVVWYGSATPAGDPSESAIVAHSLDASGRPVGSDFQVSAHTTGEQYEPAVAATEGGFVVVWWRPPGGSTRGSVVARLTAPDGSVMSGELQVASNPDAGQYYPHVAPQPGGGFVVAWQHFDELQEPAKVKSWLMRILGRKAIDRVRARRPQRDLAALHAARAPRRDGRGDHDARAR